MLPLQILYIVSGFVALSAGGFQLSKLLKKRNSDEFNLGTWLMWTGTQSISTAYALSLGDALLVMMSGAWVSFYLFMSILIIRFSSSRATLFKSVPATEAPVAVRGPAKDTPLAVTTLELSPEPAE